jgi:hypothetical protein
MNSTILFSAVKSAQKSAAIGFATILGLGIATAWATAISAWLALLIPVLTIAEKAAIFGYLPFLAGVIALNIKEQCQKKDTTTITMLLPYQPCKKPIKQTDAIPNEILIMPPSVEAIFDYHLTPKAATWQQQILNQIRWQLRGENQPTTETNNEIQETSKPAEALARLGLNTTAPHNANTFNQLNITTICWQSMSQVSELLDKIKASEMKSIAAELKIPKYRKMNKTQLLLEIVEAHNNAPEFSQ